MKKLPTKHFHLIFSIVMGPMMVFIMTFVITWLNVGMPSDFLLRWTRAFVYAYGVAVPLIYFLAPRARSMTARFVLVPSQP